MAIELCVCTHCGCVIELKSKRELANKQIEIIVKALFSEFDCDYSFSYKTIKKFIRMIGFDEVADSAEIACEKINESFSSRFKYFCGVCWRKHDEMV
jgi:hypothetical protein